MSTNTIVAPYVAAGERRRKRKDAVFHSRGCIYVARMKKPWRNYLNREDARADGGRPCMVCRP